MSLSETLLLAALVGLPLGYCLQCSRLCFNSAYREWLLHRRTTLLRMILLAVVVQMVALALLFRFRVGGLELNAVPFFWAGNLLGGLVFGFAMAYAEGCSSTVWYRLGNGNLGALVTLIGFALGEWALRYTRLAKYLYQVYAQTVTVGPPATLPVFLRIDPLWLVLPLAALAGWWLWRGKAGSYLGGWDWRTAGLTLGVLGVGVWAAGRPALWYYGVGVLGASAEWIETIQGRPGALNFGSWLLLALPLGALIAALRRREFRLQIPDIPSTLRMFSAGAVMGVAATFAGGCNIGHTFSGLPLLALSSITATLAIFLGAWGGNLLRYRRSAAS
jgi:hypothetical protein